MIMTFLAAVIASSAIPSPPRLQVDAVIAVFKSECFSPNGIAIGVRNWNEEMAFNDAARAHALAVENELNDAKRANPFNIDRYASALKAHYDDQYYRISKGAEYQVKLLRDLSPADRSRWVSRLTRAYTPPANNCATK